MIIRVPGIVGQPMLFTSNCANLLVFLPRDFWPMQILQVHHIRLEHSHVRTLNRSKGHNLKVEWGQMSYYVFHYLSPQRACCVITIVHIVSLEI